MSLKQRIAALEKRLADRGKEQQSINITFLVLTQADEQDPRFFTWDVEEEAAGQQSPALSFGGVVRLYARTGEQFKALTKQYKAAQSNTTITVHY